MAVYHKNYLQWMTQMMNQKRAPVHDDDGYMELLNGDANTVSYPASFSAPHRQRAPATAAGHLQVPRDP
jgi:hypothetical protein